MFGFVRKRKFHIVIIAIFALLSGVILAHSNVKADELEEINKQISDLQHQLELSVSATTPLEAEVTNLKNKINSIQSQIDLAEKKRRELAEGIEEREEKLKRQYVILASRVRDYYKKSRFYSPLLIFVSARSAKDLKEVSCINRLQLMKIKM